MTLGIQSMDSQLAAVGRGHCIGDHTPSELKARGKAFGLAEGVAYLRTETIKRLSEQRSCLPILLVHDQFNRACKHTRPAM
jgi:hypothetical protein